MRALPPIALALFALTPCSGATIEEIAERSMPSVVEIVRYDNKGVATGQASGFFISPQTIITNQHVIDGAYSAEVFTDETCYDRVTVLNADEDMDLAILRVDAKGAIPLRINPHAKLKPGQRVITIGHPLGLEKSLSDGLISSVQTFDGVQLVQITAPISHGSSGSPVLDAEGRVIGVVFARMEEGQNLNFAVGIETLSEFLTLEENPRQLAVAGSYAVWPVLVKWIAAAAAETDTATVYVTRTGSKYHRAGCRHLSKSKIPMTLEEAKQHCAPCSVCKPPRSSWQ
jgi:S1-C subfamily serine protease